MVLCKSSRARSSIEQASHDIGPVGVTVSESHQHMVAHLGNEHEATVAFHLVAASAVWRHDAQPVHRHLLRLPVHLHLHTSVTELVVIPGDPGHLRFGNRHLHLRLRQRVHNGRNGLERIAVIAVLTHGMRYLGDEELAQRLARQTARPLEKGTLQIHHASRDESRRLTLPQDIVRLGCGCLLLLPDIPRHL